MGGDGVRGSECCFLRSHLSQPHNFLSLSLYLSLSLCFLCICICLCLCVFFVFVFVFVFDLIQMTRHAGEKNRKRIEAYLPVAKWGDCEQSFFIFLLGYWFLSQHRIFSLSVWWRLIYDNNASIWSNLWMHQPHLEDGFVLKRCKRCDKTDQADGYCKASRS